MATSWHKRAAAMLQVVDLEKSFGARSLFSGVRWTVNPGERIGLVGPNGAGKTTLLKILAGREPADRGSVQTPKDYSIGYLPQELVRHELRDASGVGPTVLDHALAGSAEVLTLEARLHAIGDEMTHATPEHAAELAHEHDVAQRRYDTLDGATLRARTEELLRGFGFDAVSMQKPFAALSGGWAMRVELVRLLIAAPDLLLLDEPTNHLDMASLDWLERFLGGYRGAWVVVSHDRYFLNRMVTSIAELSVDGLFVFDGNYDDYIEAREELEERLAKEAADRAKRIQEIRGFVERFRAKATKARQAQSRMKLLERMERDAADGPGIPPKRRNKRLSITLPEPVRSGDVAITLTDVHKAYGAQVVYSGVSFIARRGDRISLVGPNGAGKSTLLKMLAGALEADRGERKLGHKVETYYFAQHQAESLDPTHTVLEELRALMPSESESRVRGILGAFLFSGDDVEKLIRVLSGGEKSRLALAKMLAKPANLLLLDEPTNHLDLASREVLETALSQFAGTLVFISHDRYFINRIATRLVEVKSGRLTEYHGNYDDYAAKAGDHDSKAGTGASTETDEPKAGPNAYETRKAEQRDAVKRAKELTKLESTIHTAEQRMGELDRLLCDPAVYADAPRAKALMDERATLEESLAPMYERWGELAG